MRKRYLYIAGAFWIVLALVGWYYYQKPHMSAAGKESDFKTDATSLFREFQKNETAANKKYLDKIVEVKGIVDEVSKSGQATSIQLDAGAGPAGINCSISSDGPTANNTPTPAKGATIIVKGKCAGFLADVNLVDCVVIQQ